MQIEINTFISELLKKCDTRELNLDVAKSTFKAHLKRENRNDMTINYYEKCLNTTLIFFKEQGITSTSQINDKVLLDFKTWSIARGNSPQTINKRIKAIKYLFKCLAEDDILEPVIFKTKLLPESKKRFSDISKDTLVKILDDLKHRTIKTQAIVHILLLTGVRRTELTYIKRSNVNFDDLSILLEKTKVNTDRFLFFDKHTSELLQKYLSTRNDKSDWLFVDDNGNRITPESVTKICHTIKKDLNLDSLSPHMFRHTFASSYYENGVDIETLRQLMGHSDYTMTKRYIHYSTRMLKEKHARFNPFIKLS